ncbi:MAG: FmdB family zinc ribbon protein [Planctomycetota bacterium]|jgi:putative FmdB family regulatory protein
MPLYEYVCPEDGDTITLLRPMRDADEPVDDPSGRGRRFVRKHSTFAVAHDRAAARPPGGCPCGNPEGPCNA